MINIALCDDDSTTLREIGALLEQYRTRNKQQFSYISFQNPLDLLAEIERGTSFDILLLDILMPGENGIDVAAEIRRFDTNVKILFFSSSSEFAVQSYTVDAYYYLLKPIRAEHFFPLMDKVIAACEKEQAGNLILRCKSGITRIDLKQLEYCEVIHRTLFIHLHGGKVLESIGSLNELNHQLLPYGCFVRAHRSYLINLEYVQQLSYRAVTMASAAEIPIPRGKYNEIKNAYLAYAFHGRQVTV